MKNATGGWRSAPPACRPRAGSRPRAQGRRHRSPARSSRRRARTSRSPGSFATACCGRRSGGTSARRTRTTGPRAPRRVRATPAVPRPAGGAPRRARGRAAGRGPDHEDGDDLDVRRTSSFGSNSSGIVTPRFGGRHSLERAPSPVVTSSRASRVSQPAPFRAIDRPSVASPRGLDSATLTLRSRPSGPARRPPVPSFARR